MNAGDELSAENSTGEAANELGVCKFTIVGAWQEDGACGHDIQVLYAGVSGTQRKLHTVTRPSWFCVWHRHGPRGEHAEVYR